MILVAVHAVSARAQDVDAKTASQTTATTQLSVSAFARLPFVEHAALSPDGTQMAGLFAIDGQQHILITPVVGDRSARVVVGIPDQTQVGWLRWVGNDNIVVGLTALLRVQMDNWYVSRLIGVNRATGKVTKLLWDAGGQNAADVLWVPTDDTTEILVAAQQSIYSNLPEFWPTVYRVDVTTGRKRIEERPRTNVLSWGADHLGHVRYGIGYRDHSTRSTLVYRPDGRGAFRTIDRAKLIDEEELAVPLLFNPGSDHGLVIKEDETGRSIVAEVDLVSGNDIRVVYAAPEADVEAIRLSLDGSRLLGVYTTDRDQPVHWIDPVMAAYQKAMQAASPKSDVRIVSYNQDLSKLLVRFSTADSPGLLFYYDDTAKDLVQLAEINADIGARRLARPKFIKYKARDGLEIEGVLTLPRGVAAKALPFIVMPHGGPWAHDDLSYDYWVQFLANRGYAVLQPNFRGSTGYGAAFSKAGQGQMGFAMQDDISDGVRWAIAEGIADPKRVCIVGASYGGYAAMWGIAKDPDLYRCAVSINGVSNLRREVNDFGGTVRETLYRGQWEKMTPDFAAVSPINAVDRIKTPLLLIHGKKDVTVDQVQSVKMNAAMAKAGKAVEFVSIPLADHYFTREADRITLLASIEAFLQKYNPPD
ncbi:alpha/beta hydrolase family protein [Hephaestia sp. GCM10023244]|uniref:alpha/beta hydrolase family protein n=1 Tax=unclassified Hephaestia TaxID=2631281 RepID=UPI0020770CC1|nr:S9 family peptidase [Hephaestia sp. MAHUQ-44]MCM8730391.1 S9 family peptidase [Hephaestia sp. MAHUQ-44]